MADSINSFAPRGPAGVLKALRWSLQGLGCAWRLESSFRLEVYLFVVLAPLALWLGASGVERALLLGCLVLVLAAELVIPRSKPWWIEWAPNAMNSPAVPRTWARPWSSC